MASTYSSLKIQLMGTGENTGTWGNVTNVNLGTAIEEAITGSANVSFSSANVTLTLTDTNTTQTARNLRLNCTGTTGGSTRNLVVPSIEKVYIVNNGCADSILIKTAAGSGVTVPAGKTMWVYNNGTDVVDVVTHLSSLTLSTVLPISSGGTGSNSTTYCNLQSNVTGILPNANTTASASNGASTIVARDATGNFAANTGTFTTITGAGSGVTSLNASNLASGTVPDARFPATLPTASGANLTNLNASAISSGTLANARTTASSSNGASTIVARDGSGNFSAAVITATTFSGALSGDASAATNLNASAISSGTLSNARTTASSSNGASTIVARDASGNFSAGTITANLTGLASNATYSVSAGSATTATNATNATNLVTSNFSIVESGGVLQIKYGSTVVMAIDSGGNVTSIANITAYGTI